MSTDSENARLTSTNAKATIQSRKMICTLFWAIPLVTFLKENILILLSIIAEKKNAITKYMIGFFKRFNISELPASCAKNIPIKKIAVAGVGKPEKSSDEGLVLNIANLSAEDTNKIQGGMYPTQVSSGESKKYKYAGAIPKLTKSARESNSLPISLCALSARAARPSITSKPTANNNNTEPI